MNDRHDGSLQACSNAIAEIRKRLSAHELPLVVALDGGSGAGKSTTASLIQREVDTAVIPLDDFFSAQIPARQWDAFTVEQRLERIFDWERLRQQVLEPLCEGWIATWCAFDFESGLRADGTYGMQETPKQRAPTEVILVEGTYSASPALADVLDLTILVDVSVEERHARLATREDRDFLRRWHRLWDDVEDYYFTQVRPRDSFDEVVHSDESLWE